MRKFCLVLACTFTLGASAFAQKGNNQLGIGIDLGLPVGSFGDAYQLGIGGLLKGMYGVGTAGQATLSAGYSSFKGKSSTLYNGYHMNILPVLLGYRQHFSALYVEPQVGISVMTTKVPNFHFTETKFTYAAGIGYSMKSFDLGVRYQSAAELGQIAFRIAYNIPLGMKK